MKFNFYGNLFILGAVIRHFHGNENFHWNLVEKNENLTWIVQNMFSDFPPNDLRLLYLN